MRIMPNTKVRILVNDPALDATLRDYALTRTKRLEMEKLEDSLKESLKEVADRYAQETGANVISTSEWVSVTLVQNKGQSRIDGSVLLANGVDPAIIAKATKRSPFVQYNVKVTD